MFGIRKETAMELLGVFFATFILGFAASLVLISSVLGQTTTTTTTPSNVTTTTTTTTSTTTTTTPPEPYNFSCDFQSCIFNLTTLKYTCTFADCDRLPNFTQVVIQNVTENITFANFTCSETELIQNISALVNEGIAGRAYIEGCNTTLVSLTGAYSACQVRLNESQQSDSVTGLLSCKSENLRLLNITRERDEQLSFKDFQLYLGIAVAFAIPSILWVLFGRKKPGVPERTATSAIQGETTYDREAVGADMRFRRLDQKIEDKFNEIKNFLRPPELEPKKKRKR